MDTSDDMTAAKEKRYRVDDHHLAFAMVKVIAMERAQRRDPGMKAYRDAVSASRLEGDDAASSVWTLDRRSQAPGQELTAGVARTHGALVQAAKDRELAAWNSRKVLNQCKEGHRPERLRIRAGCSHGGR